MPDALAQALTDRYRIEGPLGEGGMAAVFLARDLRHERQVALKVLRPELAAVIGADRFLHEIRLTASLQHPHILPLFDSGDAGGQLFYVMPFVDGGTLRDRLAREGRLPAEEAIRIVREVADALEHAHRRGIVHRDVKPENILLGGDHALVADFGIARGVRDAGDERLTQAGVAIGTPAYMSPEQALGDAAVDGRSDQYSLACVLHETLTGELPFEAPTAQAMLVRRLTEEPPVLTPRDISVSPAVGAAVARALAREPGDRFPSIAAFARALTAPAPAPSATPAVRPAVAVLDFGNLSADPSLDWLASGIAETVTVDLRRIVELDVIPRQAVAKASRSHRTGDVSDDDLVALGRALGARWVVSGAFQAAGGRIRITPRFCDAERGTVAPAGKLDGALDDIFTLQDRIVTELADLLKIELSAAEHADIARPETSLLAAYEHYARGQRLFNRFGEKAFAEAAEHFRQAIAADPAYALAHAGLGSVFAFRYIATTDPADLDEAIRLLQRAVELDPGLVDPLQSLTYAYTRAGRYVEAEAVGQRAIVLDPSAAMAHYFLAVALVLGGEHARDWRLRLRGAAHVLQTLALEPLFLPAYNVSAHLYLHAGRYPEARRLAERLEPLERTGQTRGPVFRGSAGILLARVAFREGHHDEARRCAEDVLTVLRGTEHVYAKSFEGVALCTLGDLTLLAGEPDVAMVHYRKAREIAEQHSSRLAMGFLFVRAQVGMARVFHALNAAQEGERQFALASGVFTRRGGFDFGWGFELGEMLAFLDLATGLAAVRRVEEALARLEEAVACGWGDLAVIDSDPVFADLRGHPALDRMRQQIAARQLLPDFPLSAPVPQSGS